LIDFQSKYFFLPSKIPKWIFGAYASFALSLLLKIKLFLLIISESICTEKVMKQKNEIRKKNETYKKFYK